MAASCAFLMKRDLHQVLNSCQRCAQRAMSTHNLSNDGKGDFIDFPSDKIDHARQKARDQTTKAFRPSVNPSSTSILLFPGQGAQFIGMGRKLIENTDSMQLFNTASEIVNYDLIKFCLEGPIKLLNRTDVCQIATLVTSIAALQNLQQENPEALNSCVATAGFSVGEYAALVFAGALSFEDAVHLVNKRAAAMQSASDTTPSGLMTVFLTHQSKLNYAMKAAKEFCSQRLDIENPVCSIANYLFPDAKVIGGHKEALEFIATNYREFHLKRVKMLPVSGAFHTRLMYPAAAKFWNILKETEFMTPQVPVHSNKHCSAYQSEHAIRKGLKEQMYHPVKWEQLMHTLYHRPKQQAFPHTYEIGPGSQLGTILKMVNNQAYQSYHSVDV